MLRFIQARLGEAREKAKRKRERNLSLGFRRQNVIQTRENRRAAPRIIEGIKERQDGVMGEVGKECRRSSEGGEVVQGDIFFFF